MPILLACIALLSAPPDHSKAYFTGLDRPHASQVEIERQGGPVILIVVDALRPDRMSAYGAVRDTTPNIKKLADEGLLLTNYFVNGNWTRPTTASMLTGLPPITHGVERERDRLADQFVTLAEVLNSFNVPTGAVVGNGNAGSAFGLSQGFDFYADTVRHWDGLPSAEQVVELAVPFVREHKDEPFFLMLFFVDPHDPYGAPGSFENMYVEDQGTRLVRTPHWELGRYSPAELERMTATYDGAVRYTDTAIGGFFDELRALNLYDKATIIVTSDHGEAFGEHGVFLHSHHFYDEIVRTPFVIKAPRMSRRGAYSHYMFQSIDLFPTIVHYYGGELVGPVPGVDIVANLAKPSLNDPQRVVISAFNNFGIKRRMARTYSEKVIFEEPADIDEFRATVGSPSLLPSVSFDGEQVALYDMGKDAFERNDLFSKKCIEEPRWKRLVDMMRAYPSARAHSPEMVERIDPETLRDLKALGYIQ